MDLFDLDPAARDALQKICEREGIDASYASFVARYLDAPDKTWRWCCGSSCDPCVHSLGRAVDRARADLQIGPDSDDAANPGAT